MKSTRDVIPRLRCSSGADMRKTLRQFQTAQSGAREREPSISQPSPPAPTCRDDRDTSLMRARDGCNLVLIYGTINDNFSEFRTRRRRATAVSRYLKCRLYQSQQFIAPRSNPDV